MPNDKRITPKKNKFLQSVINNINNGMGRLYQNTYMSTPINNRDLENIKTDFNRSLNKLLDVNTDGNGETDISALYSRVNNVTEPGQTSQIMTDLFEDNKLMDALVMDFTENKRIKDHDNEIDLILKFMPMLEDALEAKKDNVLSADNYNKDYINVVNDSNIENFEENINFIKKKYKLLDRSEAAYDDASRYGEQFIYIDNYNDALTKLLASKPNYSETLKGHNESLSTFNSNGIICESFDLNNIAKQSDIAMKNMGSVYVELNTHCIESVITEEYILEKSKSKIDKVELQQTVSQKNLNFEGISSDGFINTANTKNTIEGNSDKDKIDLTGSVVKILERENTIPLYIEDTSLGAYYFECQGGSDIFNNNSAGYQNMFSPTISSASILNSVDMQKENRDRMLKTLSSHLSSYIDKSFINANKDLKEEIYAVLKHNSMFNGNEINRIKVSYIPPNKLVHYAFKKDPITHRGISDLEKSLLPAKIYTYLYINDTIGALRSHDKRIYNVKNVVDSNISQNLINAINQIKKGNMGARELTSMKTMLNITGRFNDLVIPVGPSGESPIDFQVMDARQIDTKTDLMEMMQEMAINATNVPYEYVQSRKQVDFAVRLTMSSSKFLRHTFKRQAIVEELLSQVITILYNNEFPQENGLRVAIKVMLPPPGFLQLLNSTQLFQSVNDQVESILAMEYGDDADPHERKIMEMKLKRYYLRGYLDGDLIDKLKKESQMEAQLDKTNDDEGGQY